MSKKKRSVPNSPESYNNNPFKHLKGFAVSEPEEVVPSVPTPDVQPATATARSFVEEMAFLGVDPFGAEVGNSDERPPEPPSLPGVEITTQSDEELFLGTLGQLDVCFADRVPEQTSPATPRRLKQLKQGRLTPDASLDLHGLQRYQVAEKIEHFIQNAALRRWLTLLIVTGRGLHSVDGEPVLRDEAEKILADNGKSLIAEWGRAPRQYGGEGALVVFLKKTTLENE